MEENSEAPMDTDVSSTSEDVVEVMQASTPRHDVETVVTVEEIKEEAMSPDRQKKLGLSKQDDKAGSDEAKLSEKAQGTEAPIKKIIIKATNKDYRIVRIVHKSPNKTDDSPKKIPLIRSPPNVATQSSVEVSSSKSDEKRSPCKVPEKDTPQSPLKQVTNVEKSPIKDTDSKKSSKEGTSTDKCSPSKEQQLKVFTISKASPEKTAVSQEELVKVKQIPKEPPSTPTKDSTTNSPASTEQLTKPTKDHVTKSPSKEAIVTPTKEQVANTCNEISVKVTPVKDTTPVRTAILSPKQMNKESTPQSIVTESPLKLIIKELTPKSMAKDSTPKPIAKESTPNSIVKESASKTVAKELTSKSLPKDTTITLVTKESTPKPFVKESTPKPFVKESTPKSVGKESTSKSLAKESTPKFITAVSEKLMNDNVEVKNLVTAMDIDKEASNDSQLETCSDTSEKEHNKSISRELRSLINSAKESKIISECTQLTSKTRKSRTPLDTSSMNVSMEAEKIQGIRRGSDNSQKSGSSEQSEKALKRSMRSQNPEFVHKVKQFLNSVTGKTQKVEGDLSDEETDELKSKDVVSEPVSSTPKKKKIEESVSQREKPRIEIPKDNKLRKDPYCWRCHWSVELTQNEKVPPITCTVCPRSFHFKCLHGAERNKINPDKNWVCPECMQVLQAEGSESRSPALKKISLGMLCDLLKHALERMQEINGVEPFMQPVDRAEFPDYDKYVVHPMDLSYMQHRIATGSYGSTEAFLADTQWILHNSIIFNTLQSKLTAGARSLVRSCRTEMGEIEACPECYAGAHARRSTWFTDVCTTPHVLLWAKLKGFPYWPAKGMSVNSSGLVDVRFFGAHDRAWVPARDCFLYSEKDPNNFRTKRQDILDSMKEAEQHIRNISRKYGKFVYPPFKTVLDPSKLTEQLKMMVPSFEGVVRPAPKEKSRGSPGLPKDKARSSSKSSKESNNDGDISDLEDPSTAPRKMADGAEIAKEEEDGSNKEKNGNNKEKDNKPMEVDTPVEKEKSKEKEGEPSRKRRRSELEEAVITIMEGSKEKKKRIEAEVKPDNSAEKEVQEPTSSTKEADGPKEKPKAVETPKSKTAEPSASTSDKKVVPKPGAIRIVSLAKLAPKLPKGVPKATPSKETVEKPHQRARGKLEKSNSTEKVTSTQEERPRSKRRNSKHNKSLNISHTGKTESEKRDDKAPSSSKSAEPDRSGTKNSVTAILASDASKGRNRVQFDDDTSLAVLARESGKNVVVSGVAGLPTITCVRSLSNIEANTKSTNAGKTIEITVEAAPNSSIFTPTSTDNVRNMREAVNKLQQLRSEGEPTPSPPVGRVGVRAFARMTSSPAPPPPTEVEVEIKTEPMDLDDPERHLEKLDLMNSFQLRPVNGPSSLRDVRINKVVVTSGPTGSGAPVSTGGKKAAPKAVEVRSSRAKKTFPQPKKPEDGRSELNSKNSMVYIPIQPATQPPTPRRAVNGQFASTPPALRPLPSVATSASSSAVNTVTSAIVPVSMPSLSSAGGTSTVSTMGPVPTMGPVSTMGAMPTMGSVPSMGPVPTVGQVPTTVQTVPLITSVNGQWTFSLQPVMSLGGVDRLGPTSPPMMNGVSDRLGPGLMPLTPAAGPTPQSQPQTPQTPQATQSTQSSQSTQSTPTQTRSTSDSTAPLGEPPRLVQRPGLLNPLDAAWPVAGAPPPSTAGPLTAKLNQSAVKMTDFFRTLLEECMEKLDEPVATAAALKLQLEQATWRAQQQINELKHNQELTLAELRTTFEREKQVLVSETRRTAQQELDAAVKLAKSKQWCANCSQEAQFYCCWNTSYCDYPCQRAHWAHHYAVCTQQRSQDGNDNNPNSSENRLQPPENLPKTTAAPNLTVGVTGKLAPSRVYTQESVNTAGKPTSLIMSMMEDSSGNQSLKCVGYKATTGGTTITPLIINKQIMNNEESSKKVVTSGGYLIVGASPGTATSSTSSIVAQPRRTHTIQYFT